MTITTTDLRKKAREAALAADTATSVELADVVSDVWESVMLKVVADRDDLKARLERLGRLADGLFPSK